LDSTQPEARDGQASPKSLSNLQVSDEVYARLEGLAKQERIAVSELVSKILKATYDKN
jgi:predicted CopG family antitoxin